jgi:alpha/beta hydrolase family protein DUF900
MIKIQEKKMRGCNIMTHSKKLLVIVLFIFTIGLSIPLQGQTTDLEILNSMSNINSKIVIDIDTDTKNQGYLPLNNWTPYDPFDYLEAEPIGSGGCVLFVNDNDDDGDRIPDFAELNGNAKETNIAPLRVKLSIKSVLTQEELGKIKISFTYAGESSIGTTTGTELPGKTLIDSDNYPYYPFNSTSSKQFYDYSPIRTGKEPLRIWKSHPSLARNPNDISAGGAYIKPSSTGALNLYSLGDLGFDTTSTTGDKIITLYVEGVNEAKGGSNVVAGVYFDGVKSSEDTVAFRIYSGNIVVNSNNDSKFVFDSKDDSIEDQEDGFVFWPVSDTRSATNTYNLENAFPCKMSFPEELSYNISTATFFSYELIDLSNGNVTEISSKKIDSDLFAHLTDKNIGENIRLNSPVLKSGISTLDYSGPTNNFRWCNFILGIPAAGEYLLRLKSHFGVTVDTARINIKSVDKFVMLGNLRGAPSVSYPYPTDDSTVGISRVPDLLWEPSFAGRNSNFKKYLVLLHGYNVPLSDAKIWARVMFRRSYWQGFRGNFITVAWQGDEGTLVDFDDNICNAFQTSPSFMYFIKNKLHGVFQATADDIALMAHSMGNLVAWDALRLYQRTYNDTAVMDILSIEAAVWLETFSSQAKLSYVAPDDPIDYEVDDLKKHSWAFWFNQNISGVSKSARKSLTGKYYHSYNQLDLILKAMKIHDYLLHKRYYVDDFGLEHVIRSHYKRVPFTSSTYRQPPYLTYVPALIKKGERKDSYSHDSLTPAGTVSNSGYADIPVNASTEGWDSTSHSDCKEKPLYKVSSWYTKTICEILDEWDM